MTNIPQLLTFLILRSICFFHILSIIYKALLSSFIRAQHKGRRERLEDILSDTTSHRINDCKRFSSMVEFL
jgi:hypothetical protein